MSLKHENGDFAAEKHGNVGLGSEPSPTLHDAGFDNGLESQVGTTQNVLRQDLKGRHMQMIAMQVQHSAHVISVY